METRANYVLIGACALIAIIAGLGFFVWLAKFQIDRQYAYYDILFDNVSGLSRASDVRLSGVSVGRVASMGLDPNGLVRVRAEVAANTPIRTDATAQLRAQGVTGTSFVALTPGDETKPLLRDTTEGVPEIVAQRSIVETLTEDAPNLLAESLKLVKDLQAMAGTENQQKVTAILANIEQASASFETALSDFSEISRSVASATGQISGFTGRLDPLAQAIEQGLDEAQTTMTAMSGAFDQARVTLQTADGALKSVDDAAAAAGGAIRSDGLAAITEFRQTIENLDAQLADFGTQARSVLTAYGGTAEQATARLSELQGTIAALDRAMADASRALATVDTAAGSVNTLVSGDGAALVSDARATLASAQVSIGALETAATQDLPAIMTDVRQAIATVNTTIDRVGGQLSTLGDDLGPLARDATVTLGAATDTFRKASTALDQVGPTIASAERAFDAAEQTLSGARRAMDEDVGPATQDLRAAAARMSASLETVSADLPEISAQLKATLTEATATVRSIDSVVRQNAVPISRFTGEGLSQFSRFVQEAQALVGRLDRIAAQLQRDPARFLLNSSAPDYRR